MNIIESNLKFNNLSYGNKPNKIFLHHSEASSSIQDIHSWHLANGWSGCGYHFLVRKDGSIYRGRPENSIGSHCKGFNTGSLGICAEGNYMTETMPEVQKKAIIELCKYLCSKYGISDVKGHKEAPYATDCPGVKYPLQEIKNAIKAPANTVMPLKVIHDMVAMGVDKNGQIYPVKEFRKNDLITVSRIVNRLGEIDINGVKAYITMGYTTNR